jgi:glycerol-3-phosphate dehydrogenase
MKGRWPCTVGAFLYRLLGRVVGVPTTADVRVSLEGDLEPLAAFAPNGALIWNDGVIADLAGLQSVLRGALVTGGVEVREQVAIQSIELNDNHYRLRGAAFEAAAAVLVNCAGAGIGDVRTLAGIKGRARPNGWCKAFNLIVRPTLPTPHGVAVHGPDGRLFFLVPRGAYTAVGTSYQSLVGPPGRGKPTDEEVQNFLQQLMEIQLPFLLSEQDIHAVEWGVLPTVGVGPSGPILQGEEQIYREGRYIEVVSTKWTTFLPQARAVLAEVALCS